MDKVSETKIELLHDLSSYLRNEVKITKFIVLAIGIDENGYKMSRVWNKVIDKGNFDPDAMAAAIKNMQANLDLAKPLHK